MRDLSFFVPGVPAPQGSKSVSRSGHMYEVNKRLKPWRETIVHHAAHAYDGEPVDGPVKVTAVFYFPRPRTTRFKRYPAGKPDTDKLCRAVLDSLTIARVIRDDARVVELSARKEWADTKNGAQITVELVE